MPAYCSIQFLTGLPGSSVTLSRQPKLLPLRPAAWKPSPLTSKEVKMELTLTRPDDWHLHLRDGDLLQAVVPHSASHFGRAIVMPNLKPPITTTAAAVAYRESILKALPPNSGFDPLMTLYLTDNTSPEEIKLARRSGVVFAVKLYPAGATTNSQDGVTDVFGKCLPVLEEMVEQSMPLLVGKIQTHKMPVLGVMQKELMHVENINTKCVVEKQGYCKCGSKACFYQYRERNVSEPNKWVPKLYRKKIGENETARPCSISVYMIQF